MAGKKNGIIRNIYKAVPEEYYCINMKMVTFPFNATDFCSDSFIEPSLPDNQMDIVWKVCGYLVAGRLITVFYLRTFSFKKHGVSLAADLVILLTLQIQSRLDSSFYNTACTW